MKQRFAYTWHRYINLILLLTILFLIVYIPVRYALHSIMPRKIEAAAQLMTRQYLGKDISIREIHAGIFSGITLKDVIIYTPETQEIYLQAKTIRAFPFYPSFFLQKQIMVYLKAQDLEFNLIRDKDGALNLPLLPPFMERKKIFFMKNIAIKNVTLIFEDRSRGFKKTFSEIALAADFNFPSQLTYNLSWDKKLNLNGTYQFLDNEVTAHATFKNIDITEINPYLTTFVFDRGIIEKGNLHLKGKDSYSINGNLTIKNIAFTYNSLAWTGSLFITPQIHFSPHEFSYNAKGRITNASCANIPRIEAITLIQTDFSLDNHHIAVSSSAIIEKIPVEAKGNIQFSGNQPVSIDLKTTTQLELLIPAVKKMKPFPFEYAIRGDIAAQGTISGNMKENNWNYAFTYTIENGQWETIQNISAQGMVDTARPIWFNLQARANPSLKDIISSVKKIKPFDFNCSADGETNIKCFASAGQDNKVSFSADYTISQGRFENIQNITASGTIDTLKQNWFTLNAQTTTSLKSIIEAAIKFKKVSFPYKADGQTDITCSISVDRDTQAVHYMARYKIENGRFEDIEHIQASGEIKSAQPIWFILNAQTKTKLPAIVKTLKTLKNITIPYAVDGNAALTCTVKGNRIKNNFVYTLDYAIDHGCFEKIEDITAKGNITPDSLEIQEASFFYRQIPVKLQSKITHFASPDIALYLQSSLFKAAAQINYHDNCYDITQFAIRKNNSKISGKGTIEPKRAFPLKITGAGNLSPDDIQSILNKLQLPQPLLNKFNPQGILQAKFIITGGYNPNLWEIKIAAKADTFTISKIKAENIRLELYKNTKEFIISPLWADVATGKIEFRTKVDLATHKSSINFVANDLDLARLSKELAWKKKRLAGKVSLEVFGETDKPFAWETLSGEGKISIKNGNLWEVNFLEGLGDLLLIDDYANIEIKEGYSDLAFKNKAVIFQNTELTATEMTLRGGGKMSLKGDLDMLFLPEFNPLLIAASEGLKKFTTPFLGKILSIKVEGTVQKPVYTPKVLSPAENIKKFFQNLFE